MSCPFCEEIATGLIDDRPELGAIASREIAQSDRFRVLADISPLTPGHLIIVPAAHQLSVGAMTDDERDELVDLTDAVAARLSEVYAPPMLLEHGSDTSSDGGGCVSHAHLHLVPGPLDVTGFLSRWPTTPVSSAHDLEKWAIADEAYVFVGDGAWRGEVADRLVGIPKQFIRIEIARRLGLPGTSWDWRTNLLVENLEKTIDQLGGLSW